MTLYQIIIGNGMDDTTQTKLVLSYEPLTTESNSVKSIAKLDEDYGDYIVSVKKAQITLNAWSEEEIDEMTEVINKLK